MRTHDHVRQIANGIEGGEFTVAALDAGPDACDWAYTIGLDRCFGHPELLVVGLDHQLAGVLVERVANLVADGHVVEPYAELEIVEGVVVRPTPVDGIWLARGEWFDLGRIVMETWGSGWPSTLQLVWSDRFGGRPVVPGRPEWMLRQPLLTAEVPGVVERDVLKPDPRLW